MITGSTIAGADAEIKPLNDINELKVPFPDGTIYTKTSDYGYRTHPVTGEKEKFHSGIDLAPAPNTDIVASASGTVLETGYAPTGLGYYVYLEHDIGGQKYITAYGHMLEGSIEVIEGQHVAEKQKLGVVGTTGISTGIHLHFMIMIDHVCFKPECLIDPSFILDNTKIDPIEDEIDEPKLELFE